MSNTGISPISFIIIHLPLNLKKITTKNKPNSKIKCRDKGGLKQIEIKQKSTRTECIFLK